MAAHPNIGSEELRQMLTFTLGQGIPRQVTLRYKPIVRITRTLPAADRYFDQYDAADHAWLMHKHCDAAKLGLTEVSRKKVVLSSKGTFIEFTVKLTPRGRRAKRIFAFDGIWSGKDGALNTKLTIEHHRLNLVGTSFSKSWADKLLATDLRALKPLREEIVLEMMKRKTSQTPDGETFFVRTT